MSIMYTELRAYMKRCDLNYHDLSRITGIPIPRIFNLARSIPVDRSTILLLRFLDSQTYMMKSKEEKLAFFKAAIQEHSILEPHEILNVQRDDLEAGAEAKSELVRFYASRGDEDAVKRAYTAFDQMCEFAGVLPFVSESEEEEKS